jgi:hypothetical protein
MPRIIDLEKKVGRLSRPTKMPGFAYSLPAQNCILGSILAKRDNSVCGSCYAKKGRYVFYHVKAAMAKRLQSIQKPNWVEDMVSLIRLKYRNKEGRDRVFRWHDSGDLQSLKHLENIVAIAIALPDIKFWLPTRERKIVTEFLREKSFPKNLTVRLAAAMIGQLPTRASTNAVRYSTVDTEKGYQCPAYYQGGKCEDCRACWDKRFSIVSYPLH